MQDVWNRIERWLAANVPDILDGLNPGATMREIEETETFLGVTFPEDVRASYLIHNGQSSESGALFGTFQLLALENIRDEWSVWKDLLDAGDFDDARSEPDGPIVTDWWHPRWIPLTYNGGGDHHCLDLAPAPGGDVGQIIEMWHDDAARCVEARSFRAWLETYADELEQGHYSYSDDYGGLMHQDDLF
jgi:cell wall assembly regulator SMI1